MLHLLLQEIGPCMTSDVIEFFILEFQSCLEGGEHLARYWRYILLAHQCQQVIQGPQS